MSKRCNSNLTRAISVADYILEDGGHTVLETAKEFRLSRTSIERDIYLLGEIAQTDHHPYCSEARNKYIAVRKTLAKLKKHSKNTASN